MDALKILERGHQNLLDTIKNLPENFWTEGFATGNWTVRDIIAHLAMYETLQKEALDKFLNISAQTSLLDQKSHSSLNQFNEQQQDLDKTKPWQEILTKYNSAYSQLKQLVEKNLDILAKPATTTWYGQPASFDDVIALNFGHKKHHLAQIKLFRQRNNI